MGETPNLASDREPAAAGALRVTCPHCGAHGDPVDLLEFVAIELLPANEQGESKLAGEARFTCCGLWGDLAVAEPTPEDA